MLHALYMLFHFFFFNDTATTEIYTLSLHDALPISDPQAIYTQLRQNGMDFVTLTDHDTIDGCRQIIELPQTFISEELDRKSTRLNSSHANISYAVFCLKKKKKKSNQKKTRHKQDEQ